VIVGRGVSCIPLPKKLTSSQLHVEGCPLGALHPVKGVGETSEGKGAGDWS